MKIEVERLYIQKYFKLNPVEIKKISKYYVWIEDSYFGIILKYPKDKFIRNFEEHRVWIKPI